MTSPRFSAADTERLSAAGISSKQAQDYADAGFTSVDDIVALHAANLDPETAAMYHSFISEFFYDADGNLIVTLARLDRQITGKPKDTIRYFLASGVQSPADVAALQDAGIDSHEAMRFAGNGVPMPADMIRLTGFGFAADTLDDMWPAGKAVRWDDPVVDRLLSFAAATSRFPYGTLTALAHSEDLYGPLAAASDVAFQTAVTLTEDRHQAGSEVTADFVIESLGLL